MFLVGVCCILYAHNDGKPKDGEKKYLPDRFPFDMSLAKEDKTAYERTSQHKIVFVVGLILIIVSFQ